VAYIIKAYGSTTARFSLERDGQFVEVRAEIILENVNVSAFLPPGVSPPRFWDESQVLSSKTVESHDPEFNGWKWHVFHLKELTITGNYLIRVNDSMVVKEGTVYGHTMLWDDPMKPLVNGSPFSVYPFSTKIESVQIDNDNSFKAWNTTHRPPTKLVATAPYSYNLTQHLEKDFTIMSSTYSTTAFRFDASRGVLLSTLGEAPDFWALGILSANFADEYSAYQIEVKGDDSYLTGLVLEEFKTGAEPPEKPVQYKRPETEFRLVFYSSITLLLGVLAWNVRRLLGMKERK